MKDLYEILGVSKTATQDDIKKAFRKLAHQHHPDKSGGSDDKFKEINAAYQILSDQSKRSQYDQYGPAAFQQGGAGAGGGSWEDIMRQAGFGGGGVNVDLGDLGEMFGDMFGFGGRSGGRATRSRGRDLEVELMVEIKDTVFGAKKDVKLHKVVTCTQCSGNGAEPGTKISQCKACGGRGQVGQMKQTFFGNVQSVVVCPTCRGSGNAIEKPCRHCHGTGATKGESTLSVAIPQGINEGETLRIRGEGEAGAHGAGAGDLFIHIRVKPDSRYTRHGNDLLVTVPIALSMATLGGTVTVETLDGPVEMKIPAGTQSGTVFRLAHLGVPHLQRSGRGHLLATVEVAIPKHLSKKQRELIEKLKDEGI